MADTFYSGINLVISSDAIIPISSALRIIAKADGKIYSRDSSGVEVQLSNDAGGAAVVVPTTAQANFVIGDNQQVLFRRKIVFSAGQRLVIGTNSALIGV